MSGQVDGDEWSGDQESDSIPRVRVLSSAMQHHKLGLTRTPLQRGDHRAVVQFPEITSQRGIGPMGTQQVCRLLEQVPLVVRLTDSGHWTLHALGRVTALTDSWRLPSFA